MAWIAEIEVRLVNEILRQYVDPDTLAQPGCLTLVFPSEEVGQQALAEQLPTPSIE